MKEDEQARYAERASEFSVSINSPKRLCQFVVMAPSLHSSCPSSLSSSLVCNFERKIRRPKRLSFSHRCFVLLDAVWRNFLLQD
jgi:hypothetical protein